MHVDVHIYLLFNTTCPNIQATAMGGRKLMYSQLYQNAGQFWSVYDKGWYDSLRRRYVAANDTIATVPDIHKKLMFQTK